MEIRKNGTVELNDRDIDKIRLDRIAEVEKQRDYLLPSCSEIPKDEFGLFNKEDFNKWVNADSDRQKELWDSVYEPHMDGLDDEVYEKGLSTKTPEFRREMILDWFLGYLKKRITDDESLEDSTKEAMKKIIDDKGASFTKIGSIQTGIIYYLQPVFSMIGAFLVLGTPITSAQIFGGLIVILGILTLNHFQKKEAG